MDTKASGAQIIWKYGMAQRATALAKAYSEYVEHLARMPPPEPTMRLITSQAQHDVYLARIGDLMNSQLPLSVREAEELELLSLVVEDYEKKNFPIKKKAKKAAKKKKVRAAGEGKGAT